MSRRLISSMESTSISPSSMRYRAPTLTRGVFQIRMLHGLTEKSQCDRLGVDRRILQIAKPVFEVRHAMPHGEVPAELDHLLGIVHRDDLQCALGKELGERSLACTQIGNHHRRQ